MVSSDLQFSSCRLKVRVRSTSASRSPQYFSLIGFLTAKNDFRNYIPLVNTIGLLFQIRDDYMNLASPEYTSNKGLCEDLTEGKFSFPIIHSIAFNPSNRQLLSILKQKTEDSEVKRYAVKYMESTGSFAYCREVLKQLKAKAIGMIDDLDLGADTGAGVRVILDKMDVSTSMP